MLGTFKTIKVVFFAYKGKGDSLVFCDKKNEEIKQSIEETHPGFEFIDMEVYEFANRQKSL